MDVQQFKKRLERLGSGWALAAVAVTGLGNRIELQIAREIDEYHSGARVCGIPICRADAILDEEMVKSQSSTTVTTFDAVRNARRRLARES